MNGRKIHAWINTLIVIVGGILGYLLVDKYEAKLNNAETIFTGTQTQLANIELSVKYLKEELNINEKRLKVSSDIMEIITNIIPSIRFDDIKVEWAKDRDKIDYYARLINTGKLPFELRAIYLEGPPNIPYETEIFPVLPLNNINRVILPGQGHECHITFTFQDTIPKLNDKFSVNYKVQILDSVKNAVSSILKDVLPEEEINRISKGSYPCYFRCIEAEE